MEFKDIIQECNQMIDQYCEEHAQEIKDKFSAILSPVPTSNNEMTPAKKILLAQLWHSIKERFIEKYQRHNYPLFLKDINQTINSVYDLNLLIFRNCFLYLNSKVDNIVSKPKATNNTFKPIQIMTELDLNEFLQESLKTFQNIHLDTLMTRDKEIISKELYGFLDKKIKEKFAGKRCFIITFDNERTVMNNPETEMLDYLSFAFDIDRIIKRRYVDMHLNNQIFPVKPKVVTPRLIVHNA